MQVGKEKPSDYLGNVCRILSRARGLLRAGMRGTVSFFKEPLVKGGSQDSMSYCVSGVFPFAEHG